MDRLHVQQLGIRSLAVAAASVVVVAAAVLAQCQHLQAERKLLAAPPVVRWSPHHRYTKETSASISYDRPLRKRKDTYYKSLNSSSSSS